MSDIVKPVDTLPPEQLVLELQHEIAERKQAEAALRESEARYRDLLAQARVALRKSEALYQVNRSLSSIQNLHRLLQSVVDSMAEALAANRVTAFIVDLDRHQVLDYVKAGPGEHFGLDWVEFDELWAGLTGWVLRELKPALSPASPPDPREGPQVRQRRADTNCGSVLVVPLRYQDKTLGTMTAINLREEREFTQDDVELMSAMAKQAAIAIENARLYDELQSAHAELEKRVTERTAELARTNASLEAEIAQRRLSA